MSIFKLPDLGEGLPDAEIHEWFVKEGDTVITDQPLVSMETAKAVVDVPAPHAGIITRLYGKQGDIIKTGDPLVAFEDTQEKPIDKGTVVGNLEESHEVSEDNFTIGKNTQRPRILTTPAVRLLAKKLGVSLTSIPATGENSVITRQDVENIAAQQGQIPEGFEPLRGVRRAMLNSMILSHQEVVPVSIYDEVDISRWSAQSDITVRLIQAIVIGCQQEPALNAWFYSAHHARKCFDTVNLGIAMDSEDGLFVPVITDAGKVSTEKLRDTINTFKQQVQSRTIAQENLHGATITLSNFGKFSGKFASPIIVPPQVAILAVGRLYENVVMEESHTITTHRFLPLSLTFDHRAVTGGEATRFLGAVMNALTQEK